MPSQEYDSEILKKLQKTELEILKDFVKICDKYNLPYFATGGTAIGALPPIRDLFPGMTISMSVCCEKTTKSSWKWLRRRWESGMFL